MSSTNPKPALDHDLVEIHAGIQRSLNFMSFAFAFISRTPPATVLAAYRSCGSSDFDQVLRQRSGAFSIMLALKLSEVDSAELKQSTLELIATFGGRNAIHQL